MGHKMRVDEKNGQQNVDQSVLAYSGFGEFF